MSTSSRARGFPVCLLLTLLFLLPGVSRSEPQDRKAAAPQGTKSAPQAENKEKKKKTMSQEIEITPQELAHKIKSNGQFFLLDVREPWEYQAAHLEGSTLIPMGEVPAAWKKIPEDKPVVVYCHHGRRSLKVTLWLREQGIEAQSLQGGIDRWSLEIDPKVPRYE